MINEIKNKIITFITENDIDLNIPFVLEMDDILNNEYIFNFICRKDKLLKNKTILALILGWKKEITIEEENKYIKSKQSARVYQSLRNYGFIMPFESRRYKRIITGVNEKIYSSYILEKANFENKKCYFTNISIKDELERDHITPVKNSIDYNKEIANLPKDNWDDGNLVRTIFQSVNYKKREECKKCQNNEDVSIPQVAKDVEFIINILSKTIINLYKPVNWDFKIKNNKYLCSKGINLCYWNYCFEYIRNKLEKISTIGDLYTFLLNIGEKDENT